VLTLSIGVLHFHRAPITLRGIALAVALSVATAGSGLPMCLSLLAESVAPCAMHAGHNGAATHQHAAVVASVAAQPAGRACHPDAAGLGCAAGSACPTGGPAAPTWIAVPVTLSAASRVAVLEPVAALISHLAPPPSPPPQA
jgi:hypothetical protein